MGEETKEAQRPDFERLYYAKYSLEIERIVSSSKDPVPRLHCLIRSGDDYADEIAIQVPETWPKKDMEEIARSIERKKLSTGVFPDLNRMGFPDPSLRYNQQLDVYKGKMQEYVKELDELSQLLSKTIRIDLAIECDGVVPAKNIEIDIYIGNGAEPVEKIPELPKEPHEPISPLDVRSQLLAPWRDGGYGGGADLAMPHVSQFRTIHSQESGPTISNALVQYTLRELKHGRRFQGFDPFYILLTDEAPTPTQLSVTIYADNIPDPISHTLQIHWSLTQDDNAWLEHTRVVFGLEKEEQR